MTYIKGAIVLIMCYVMLKACAMDYKCNVLDSIPEREKEVLFQECPSRDLSVLSDYYLEHKDRIQADIQADLDYEKEMEEYKINHPEEFEDELE